VPRFFLHLRYRDGTDGLAVDEEGDDLPDLTGLPEHVEATARDLMRNTRLEAIPDWRVCTFEVTDETGSLVLTLPFSEVASRG
jgi:uncharacterized protein DUF6894